MIEDDAQIGDPVGNPQHRFDQVRPGIGGIESKTRGGERFQAGDELGFRCFGSEISAPQIAISDASKERIPVIALQVFGELRLARLEVPDGPDHEWLVLRDFQHPEVVLDPGTGFDFNRTDDAERRRDRLVSIWQRGYENRSVLAGVGDPLWPGRVVEMNVSVQDRNRRCLGACVIDRDSRRRGQKRPAA